MTLMYDGHAFGDTSNHCSCCDADPKVVIDPTNTFKLRRRFKGEFTQRWTRLRAATRRIILEQDVLGLKAGGLMQALAPAIVASSTKVEVWQRWFDSALDKLVIGGDASWTRPYISTAFDEGTKFGQLQAQTQVTHRYAGHRSQALQVLARVELQGIAQAVSQQATRAVANGLLTGLSPMQIVRNVWVALDKIGRIRADALVELLVVRAHAEASLDVYEAHGIATVGLLPEAVAAQTVRTGDAKKKQKATSGKAVSPTHGAGSRSRGATPSLRTIQRIRRAELNIAKRLGENVNVKTAGDNRVCPVCKGISSAGPYTIARARSLIPAHPRCRCVFVPVSTAAKDGALPVVDDYEENKHPRDPHGRWTNKAGGEPAPIDPNDPVKGTSSERVALRKALAKETDPAKRKMIQQKIIDSFHKQYKKKPDPDIAAKLAKYSKQYQLANPLSNTPAMLPGGYVAHKTAPSVEKIATKLMAENPPVPGHVYTPEEKEAFRQLSHLGSAEQAKMWMGNGKKLKQKFPGSPANEIDIAHINAYTGAGYRKVNTELRSGSMDEETYNHATALNNALGKLPGYQGTVYRKAKLTPQQAALYSPGKIIQERGFTSTSKDPATWSGSHQYIIQSRSGKDIQHLSNHISEQEVLFRSGTHFRVTKVSGTKIYMEEI